MNEEDSKNLAVLTESVRIMKQDIHEVKADVKDLLSFKWKSLGAVALIVVFIQLIQIAKAAFK